MAQNCENNAYYDGVVVGVEEAQKLRRNHINFCKRLLRMLDVDVYVVAHTFYDDFAIYCATADYELAEKAYEKLGGESEDYLEILAYDNEEIYKMLNR